MFPFIEITRDGLGRYVVKDTRRVYGCYKTMVMALYRKLQIEWSRQPVKEERI